MGRIRFDVGATAGRFASVAAFPPSNREDRLTAEEVAHWIEAFDPGSDRTLLETRKQILQFLDSSPDPMSRTNYQPGHLTASGIVFTPDVSRFLLIEHNRLSRWLQPGGHVEKNDADPRQTAAREVVEETSVSLQNTEPILVGMDIHEIPAARGEPRHLHHDLAFLFQAKSEQVRSSGENRRAAWCRRNEMAKFGLDASIHRHVRRAWEVVEETDILTISS